MQRLRAFLGPRADSPIDELSKADLVAFRAARSAQVSSTSVNLDIRVARMLFLCTAVTGSCPKIRPSLLLKRNQYLRSTLRSGERRKACCACPEQLTPKIRRFCGLRCGWSLWSRFSADGFDGRENKPSVLALWMTPDRGHFSGGSRSAMLTDRIRSRLAIGR